MKQKKKFFILLLVLVGVLALALGIYNGYTDTIAAEQGANGTEKTTPAPEFTVYDGEGNPVKLSDFRGKPVVLNFWATWCTYCVYEMPDFQEKYEELGDEVQFLMINATDGSRETVEKAKEFLERNEFTFPVYYDLDFDAISGFGIVGYPMTFFIDAEGNVVGYVSGAADSVTLQYGIDLITGK